jgi:hypothetical protein
MRARRTLAVALALAAVLLAGCAGIPTDGPVRAGDGGVATPEPVLPILQGPQPGDDPLAIMQGFITASAGGPVSGFDIAREYLSKQMAAEWSPLQQVTIFDSRNLDRQLDEETGVVTFRVPVAAVVDESGVMTESAPDARQDIEFTVTQTDSGEYRISQLDNGIIISEANFVRYFRPVALQYATTDLAVQVPEYRWFANNEQLATVAARELVEGPSVWLADAVITGFPATSSLAVDAVVVEEGVAHVSLAAGSAGTPEERALAAEQMELTLTQLPTVSSVTTTVGGVPLTASDQSQLAVAPIPDARAAVIASGRFGLWDSSTLELVVDESGAVPVDARGLALSYDMSTAAFITSEGLWVTDAPARAESFTAYDSSAPVPESELDARLLIPGASLVSASYDRHGWVWTTSAQSAGVLRTAPASGELDAALELAAPWLVGRTVDAVSVSKDGARVAILSRAAQQPILEVAGIVRDAAGTPISIGPPLAVAPSIRPSIDVSWSEPRYLVVLGEVAGDFSQGMVGGPTTDISSLAGAAAFSVRYGERSLVAVTDAGELQVRSGNSWARQQQGITDVAFAG